ncbi:hypothetical protein ElyMa_000654700 [Elysia marginata]|uniref:Uncharacterized protein n=1 Tax=Elysia marginata TaxID=1093978 RepID=A0AAV4GD66_9GAST|nr:hypothetical protein ElyMa_000654700 [Elysia marginata]
MPVSGFPTILENILISMLQESQPASYKLARNEHRIIFILRLHAMTNTSLSTTPHEPTPAKVRRQLGSDRRRLYQRFLPAKEDAPICLHNKESKTKQTPMIDRTKTTKPSKLDLSVTLSRSDRPSQQELYVPPKYSLSQKPLNETGLLKPTDAQD